jgi:hypothetical protein
VRSLVGHEQDGLRSLTGPWQRVVGCFVFFLFF